MGDMPRQVWQLYAAIKYWSAETYGPRNPDGSMTLEELAVAYCNVLEGAWRQGHRTEALMAAVRAEIKRRQHGSHPKWPVGKDSDGDRDDDDFAGMGSDSD